MYSCPNCGGIRGQHSSVLQGCMCQWQMQAPVMQEGKDFTISKPWVGLNWDDLPEIYVGDVAFMHGAKWAEGKLKEKNGG